MGMTKVAVVGAGKIGEMILGLLLGTEDYEVSVFDASEAQFERLPNHSRLTKLCIDVTDEAALSVALSGHFAVLSATPFFLTRHVAKAAVDAGVHYLDLTEDVASTEYVKSLAENAECALIPQCGLAPGFISIVANDVGKGFDELDTIRMCVGALPQFPSNSLNYNLTWSTDGVINEYCEPCVAVKNGEHTMVPALEHLEHFSLDGIAYESFNTSGGLVSKGHPVGATGLSMVAELAEQLRAEAGDRQVKGARYALAENGGGVMGFDEAACSVIILEAP